MNINSVCLSDERKNDKSDGTYQRCESNPLHKVPVMFGSTSMTVRFGLCLPKSSGSFGSILISSTYLLHTIRILDLNNNIPLQTVFCDCDQRLTTAG